MWKCAVLNNQENPYQKSFKLTFSGTIDIKKYDHDTIQCLKNVVHDLNMKIPDILVKIIELVICTSLKWFGM